MVAPAVLGRNPDSNAERLFLRVLQRRERGVFRRLSLARRYSRDSHEETAMDKISPCLWFDGEAEEAARFYTSLFPNSHIDSVERAAADTPSGPKGSVLTVTFTLAGQSFIGLNGGPDFKFNEAISMSIDCDDQAEVDRYWAELVTGGGEHSVCGWLKDRFGVSWQVIPRQLPDMLASSDRSAAERAMKAMLDMTKIDVAALREAYEGQPVGAR
jgi:predicted 3-demethylubiquinone-9 3-methyltransferase (glyoxalase superfamily)